VIVVGMEKWLSGSNVIGFYRPSIRLLATGH
jgi:hypothetical protein